MSIKLFQHQQLALEKAKEQNLALFHECGCGKTLTALKIIAHHKEQGNSPALVVCPLSIIESAWMDDCRNFTPDLSIVSLWHKSPAERYRRLKQDADIFIVNFETFRSMFELIQCKGFQVVIVDESSKMKSPSSQTTRALLALAGVPSRGKGKKFAVNEVIPHRYILSGTPAPNDRSEYWGQMNFIAPNTVFSDNFFAFRSRYFTPMPLGRTGINLWKFTKDPYLEGEFNAKMVPVCDVVRKQDAVDLPCQTHEVRKVNLSKAERSAYQTFRDELVLRFASEEVLASSALVEIMKARQLTSGFCYGQNRCHQTGKSKLNELLALLDEIGVPTGHRSSARQSKTKMEQDYTATQKKTETQHTGKSVIIWCSFRKEIETLLKILPDSAALWSGTVDRQEVIKGFKSGKYQYLIANPQSAGHGLTFTHCSDAVYFSLAYSYELLKQSQDRIHRIGQRQKCTYYYLIAKDTIDEVVYDAVQEKKKLSESVLCYLKGTTNGHEDFN